MFCYITLLKYIGKPYTYNIDLYNNIYVHLRLFIIINHIINKFKVFGTSGDNLYNNMYYSYDCIYELYINTSQKCYTTINYISIVQKLDKVL